MAMLTRTHRVLRYDTRGHGRSSLGSEPVTMSRLVADVVPAPELPQFAPAPTRKQGAGWTAERQRRFIEHLSLTGSVGEAAAVTDMSSQSAYRLRNRAGAQSFAAQSLFSFLWGFIVSGTIYVNLAGFHVKSVDATLTGRASGVFVTSLYAAAAVAGYLLGFLANCVGWGQAGLIQITALSVIGLVLSLGLRSDRISVRGAATSA